MPTVSSPAVAAARLPAVCCSMRQAQDRQHKADWSLSDSADRPQASLACAVLLGVAMAEVGVSVMHDANHGAGGAGARGVLGATLDMVHRPWTSLQALCWLVQSRVLVQVHSPVSSASPCSGSKRLQARRTFPPSMNFQACMHRWAHHRSCGASSTWWGTTLTPTWPAATPTSAPRPTPTCAASRPRRRPSRTMCAHSAGLAHSTCLRSPWAPDP